jgi:hypothetical protein
MNNEFTSSNAQTDWQRLDAMGDEDIDLSDCPGIMPEMFAKAVVRQGLPATKTGSALIYEPEKNQPETNSDLLP